MSGEYVRFFKYGWDTPAYNWSFWEDRLGHLLHAAGTGFWSPEGMFLDNTGADLTSPMAYDAFGSSYVALLLDHGYNQTGYYSSYLATIMERGLWTRAAYQSPLGEQPVGGRSNQHQFAEAVLAAVAEKYSRDAASRGDTHTACVLKRVARLYHSSVDRWLRHDGALQITKNWFLDSSNRFGYMSYSFFSNYNLLPASWLSFAYDYASDDTVDECASPADVGGVAFSLSSRSMRKAYASLNGTYLEIITGADPEYDASGLNRFHFDACSIISNVPCRLPSLIGPSQAPGLCGNTAAAKCPNNVGLSAGCWWSLDGGKIIIICTVLISL